MVLSQSCPFNLLGRDALAQLRLCIIPNKQGGMSVIRLDDRSDLLLQCSPTEPNYYWTLDLIEKDPAQTSKALWDKAKTLLNEVADVINPSDLHITLRYKHSPGPDLIYHSNPSHSETLSQIGRAELQLQLISLKERCSCMWFATPRTSPWQKGIMTSGRT